MGIWRAKDWGKARALAGQEPWAFSRPVPSKPPDVEPPKPGSGEPFPENGCQSAHFRRRSLGGERPSELQTPHRGSCPVASPWLPCPSPGSWSRAPLVPVAQISRKPGGTGQPNPSVPRPLFRLPCAERIVTSLQERIQCLQRSQLGWRGPLGGHSCGSLAMPRGHHDEPVPACPEKLD